jgi:hypothetical protein
MLQLAPRGEIAVPMAGLEDPDLLGVKTYAVKHSSILSMSALGH